jgi:hypothetical protein
MNRSEEERTEADRRARRTGGKSDSEDAARTAAAKPDAFGRWFATQAGRLSKDFELEI